MGMKSLEGTTAAGGQRGGPPGPGRGEEREGTLGHGEGVRAGSLTPYRMWNFSLAIRPSLSEQRYQAETSFMETQRRSSLR
jgi:hypothetical protein